MIRPERIWVPEAPYLITRPTLEVGEVPVGFGIEGYFAVELIHARTGLVQRRLEFKNTITDAAIKAIASGTGIGDLTNYLAVGTGTKEPEVTDTALQAEFSRTNSNGGFGDTPITWGPDYAYIWKGRYRLFTESQANGTISEVGFFNAANGGVLFNRQLLRDGNGLPTTITKGPDQQLKVYFMHRIYGDMVGTDGEVMVMGTPTAVRTRAYQITEPADGTWIWLANWMGQLNANSYNFYWYGQCWENNAMPATVFASQTGASGDGGGGPKSPPYVAGTTYRDLYHDFSASQANFATGFGSMTAVSWAGIYARACMIATFNPKIPKNDSRKLRLNFRIHYGRHTP